MNIEELKKIYKWARHAINRKTGAKYKIKDYRAKMMDPVSNEWVDAVIYMDGETFYCIDLATFLEEFDVDLSDLNYCEMNNCPKYIYGISTCDGVGC